MSKALDLATLATGNFATNTDVTDAINGIVFPDGGKVLQVVNTSLATTNFINTGNSIDLISQAITLSSANNFLYVVASVNYDINGDGSTANPDGAFELSDGTTTLAEVQAYRDAHTASVSLTGGTTLQAYYSPATINETIKLVGTMTSGGFYVKGSNHNTNATTLTIMEIAA